MKSTERGSRGMTRQPDTPPSGTETRFYIALTADQRPMTMVLGPGSPDQFLIGPREPIQLSPTNWAYPVSEEIAEIWMQDDE